MNKNHINTTPFDIEEPNLGHFDRFEAKLKKGTSVNKRKNPFYKYIAIAATFLLIFSLGINSFNNNKGIELAAVSSKMEETQHYFSSVIFEELEKIAKEKNNDNKQIIDDALLQLQILETDYKKQTFELKENNQNKQIIFAMINNFQQRITILQNLVTQLDDFKQLKNNYNENNTL